MGKREEDAKAWKDFITTRLLPRLQREKGQHSQVGVCVCVCVAMVE
jgi:hypothetical protein